MKLDPRRGPQSVVLAVVVLLAVLGLFEATALDRIVQDHFFDPATRRWWVDWDDHLGRALFYHVPKVMIIAVGVLALALALGPRAWRARFALERRGLLVAVLTLASVPLLAGAGKRWLDVHCPYDLRIYGGEAPYVRLCECGGAQDPSMRRGGCFPAGHASGGFALLGLLAVRRSARWRRGAVAVGLVAGWWMGAYQMLRGAHFLSHTVTTLLLAWSVATFWCWLLVERSGAGAAAGTPER